MNEYDKDDPSAVRDHLAEDIAENVRRSRRLIWGLFILFGVALLVLMVVVFNLNTQVYNQQQHLKSVVACDAFYQHRFQQAIVTRSKLSSKSSAALIQLIQRSTKEKSTQHFQKDVQTYINSVSELNKIKVPEPHYRCA